MQKTIKAIHSFSRFYQSVTLQWEKNLLCRGYDLYEIRTLLELYFLGVCTPRELASRLDFRVENMHAVLMRLQDAELIQKITEWKDPFFSHVRLTEDGRKEAMILQTDHDDTITSALRTILEHEQKELVEHMKKVMDILQEAEIRKCRLGTKVRGKRMEDMEHKQTLSHISSDNVV